MNEKITRKSSFVEVLNRTKNKSFNKKKIFNPIFVGNSLGKDEQVTVSANRKGDTLFMSAKTLSVADCNTKVYQTNLKKDKN